MAFRKIVNPGESKEGPWSGGKRKRDTAFGWDFRRALTVMRRIPSCAVASRRTPRAVPPVAHLHL